MGVVINWIEDAFIPTTYEDFTNSDEINTFWYAAASVFFMLFYRIISGIMYKKTYGTRSGIAQFCDVMLFREVYEAHKSHLKKPTVGLRWIRRMEAVFESTPQTLLQLVFLLKQPVMFLFDLYLLYIHNKI